MVRLEFNSVGRLPYILILFFLFGSIRASLSQAPKGDRTLAWQVDLPQSGNYDTAFSFAQTACMESIHLFFRWNDLEPDTGSFDPVFMASFLDVVNIYYPATGTEVELQFAITNTVAEELPSELTGLPLDDPLVISSFNRALDTLFAHIPAVTLSALNIGNESDIVFGTDPSYLKKSIQAVKRELKQLRDKKLGIKQMASAKEQLMGQLAMAEEKNTSFMLMMGKSLLDIGSIEYDGRRF